MEEKPAKDDHSQFNSEKNQDFPGQIADQGAAAQISPPPGKPTPGAQPLRIRVLRWTIGVIVLFGLGFVVAVLWLYLPMRQEANRLQSELQQTEQQMQTQADQSEERIASLQREVDRLSQVESQNTALQGGLEEQELHSAILAARMDVSAAQLALLRDDPARMRLAFVKTPETWDLIASRLQPDQRAIVKDLRGLMDLALSSAENEPAAAETALSQLAASLLELENAYFARP